MKGLVHRHGPMAAVYVAGVPGYPQKVGISKDPARRLRVLPKISSAILNRREQRALPPNRLVFASPLLPRVVALEVEAAAHCALARGRGRRWGEWFHASPEEAVAAVKAALEKAGVDLIEEEGGGGVKLRVGG